MANAHAEKPISGEIFGYARVSSDDQSLDMQREPPKAAGCDVILEEQVSGATVEAVAVPVLRSQEAA